MLILPAAVTVLGLVALFAASALGFGQWAGIFKMLASCGFIALAVAAGAFHSPYGWLILIGLFFSWWGDLFLISSQDTIFLFGLIAFFIAHVAYAAAFLSHGVRWSYVAAALLVLAIAAFIVAGWLSPNLGDMRLPVYAYIVVITLMVALSIGAVGRGAALLVAVGALLFYFSDLFVARQRFVTPSDINRLVGLPLYYAAQLVLAYTIKLLRA